MSLVVGKNDIGKSKGKAIPRLKGKAQARPTASNRFNYLINCKHDLKNAQGCPMCRLIHIVTRKHFDYEREQTRLAHEQSLVNRAQLRLTLMLRWARTQSNLYNKYVSAPTFDIVFSKSLASILVDEDAVMSREQPIDFDEVLKVLERRNRIQEVGHFAAVFLQARIRKYLAKRFVRRMVLQRFEYVPATRRKPAFYIDTYWSRKRDYTPRFLLQEPPATPRTIGRRLAADERQRNARYESFKKDIMKRYRSIEGADVWAQEETTVRFLKQMGVLRDLVRIAMLNITKMRTQREAAAERLVLEARRNAAITPATASTPNAQGLNRRGSVSNRINLQRQADEAAAAVAALSLADSVDPDAPVEIQPVWMCLSAPGMSARELGLALALATVPSPATGQLLMRKHAEYGLRTSPAAAPTTAGGMTETIPPPPADDGWGGGGRDRSMSFGPNSRMGSPGVGKLNKLGTMSLLFVPGGRAASPAMGLTRSREGTPNRVTRSSTAVMGTPTAASKSSAGNNVTSSAQLLRALNFLEQSLWQCLRCSTPEEVLSKLLVEELRPTFESVMNITKEDKQIWRGKIGHMPSVRAATRREERRHSRGGISEDSSLASEDRSDSSGSEADEPVAENEEFTYEVLPLTLQLRPYYPERGCNGFFRLFFYMDELIIVSAVSPWAFYPEVMKNRDLINNSLRAYAALPATRAFLQQYLTRANMQALGQDLTALAPGDLQPVAALTRGLTALHGLGSSVNVKGGTGSGKNTPQRRPSVNLNSVRENTNARRKSLVPPPISTSAAPERGAELTHLFAPPEELIYQGTAPDRAAINRMRDISQFNDEKVMYMSKKYSFLNKNTAFMERLKRAEHNAATRLKRRGATAATPGGNSNTTIPSKAALEHSVPHQRRLRLQEWFTSDPHLSPAALIRGGPLGEELNSALVRDLHAEHHNLIGGKLMHLLLGPEAGEQTGEDSVNNFGTGIGAMGSGGDHSHTAHHAPPNAGWDPHSRSPSKDTRTSSIASASSAATTGTAGTTGLRVMVGSTAEEQSLPDYEAKLHRYSSKARVEIMERLRRPFDVPRVKELFPLVVMDVYVHLPGKAGLGTPGTPSTPSASASAFQGSTGSMRRGFSAASGVTIGSDAPTTPSNSSMGGQGGSMNGGLQREATSSSSINTSSVGGSGSVGLLAVDLQQIVGAFSCDSDKPPPNLDCGLSSWDHFYRLHQARVSAMFPSSSNAFTEGSSSSSVGSASTKGSSSTFAGTAGAASQRSNYWTSASSETGISTYVSNLPSGLQYQFHMLASAPSRAHLERTLPRKVKEWVGLHV